MVVSGLAEHDADLHPDLVDEDHHGVGTVDRCRQLAERLAHQPCLKAGELVAHLALDLGPRRQRRDRIDDEHVDGPRADERVGDLERLLAGVGLGNEEVVEGDAKLPGISRVERMLCVDEAANAAVLLGLGDGMEGERRLAGGFRPVDFDDSPARQAADAKSDVEAERAGRHGLDLDGRLVLAEAHDRTLAEGAFDLAERRIQRLRLVH